jgi:energy-converting hydrogenase Eha subunit C
MYGNTKGFTAREITDNTGFICIIAYSKYITVQCNVSVLFHTVNTLQCSVMYLYYCIQ